MRTFNFFALISILATASSCTTDETMPLPPNQDAGVVSCGSGNGTPEDAAAYPDGGAAVTLSVPTTHASIEGVPADVTGFIAQAPFSPRLVGGKGTIFIDGVDVPAAITAHEMFEGYDLYQVLAVSPDRLAALWYYCKGGALDWLYVEDTRGMFTEVTALQGKCEAHAAAASLAVDFPATSFAAPRPVHGYRINGTSIAYDGTTAGHATIAGTDYTLYPFVSIDCTGSGWQELHALLWNASKPALGMGILYLFPPAAMRSVQLSFVVLLPLGEAIPDTVFPDATWMEMGQMGR